MTAEAPTSLESHPKTYYSWRNMESDRYSGFDLYAAIGELIDNSVEAGATAINILVDAEKEDRSGRGRRRLVTERLAVVDDGYGMPRALVEDCLISGESTRYGSRSGIGRFGVGMYKGSISQSRHIEVYSKQVDGAWYWSYLDLDEVKERESVVVNKAVPKTPPKDLEELVGGEHGTIVVWNNNDLMTSPNFEEIRHWIGRTYRKSIAPEILTEDAHLVACKQENTPVKICLNGERIAPYDPLFVFPNVEGDPAAEPGETILIPRDDRPEDLEILLDAMDKDLDDLGFDPYENPIRIRMNLLPEGLREEEATGGKLKDGQDHLRRIDKNTGFSILRHGREVYYGEWVGKLHLGSKQEGDQLDRYWGMEIAFDPGYDELFQVRNVKVGAKPVGPLGKLIDGHVKEIAKRFRKDIRHHWARHKPEPMGNDARNDPGPDHDEPTSTIGDSAPPKEVRPTKEEMDRLVDVAKERGIIPPDSTGDEAVTFLEEFIESLKHRYTIVPSENKASRLFMDVTPGGKTVLTYYILHPFFRFRNELLMRLQEGNLDQDELALEANNIRRLLDLMLYGFAKGYVDILREESMDPRMLLDQLMHRWSQTLDSFISQLEARHEG